MTVGMVVTGTDTGVGKTVVAAALARLWADAGDSVVYVKPVQSGAASGDDDAAQVAFLAGVPTVTGRLIEPALAPAVGARLAGDELTCAELVAAVPPGRRCVVEGAGGALVELGTDGTTVLDLAATLALPLLVVARPGLGTLNHTTLTLEAIDRRGLACAGVVVAGYPPVPDLAARTNLGELDRLSGGRLVGMVPIQDLGRPLTGCAAWFAATLGGNWEKRLPAEPASRHADRGGGSGAFVR